MADEEKRVLIHVEDNLNEYIQRAVKTKETLDEMRQRVEELRAEKKTEGAEWEKANANLRNAQKEYKEAKRNVDLYTTASNSQAESRKQLNALYELEKYRLGALKDQYVINEKGQRVLSESYLEQVKRLKDAKDAIIAYDKAQSDGRSSVGLYAEAIESTLGKFAALPGPVGAATGSVQGFNKSLKALLLNPVGLAITAIVLALKGLVELFKSNQEGADKFAGVLKGLGVVLKEIIGRIYTFAQATVQLFKGNFAEAAKLAKDAFTGLGTSIKEAFTAGVEQQKLQVEITREEIAMLERRAQRERDIAELKLKSRDAGEGSVKQAEYLRKAQDLINANLQDELNLQQKRVRLAEMVLNATHESQRTDEQRRKVAEERAKLLELETRALNEQGGLMRSLNTLDEQALRNQEKLRQAAEKRRDALKKEIDDFLNWKGKQKELDERADERRKQKEIELAEWRQRRDLINEQNILEAQETRYADEFSLRRQHLELMRKAEVQNAQDTGADVNIINEKYARAQVELAREEQDAKLALYGDFAGNVAVIFGKNTKIGKMAAVAQTTIATYQSAVEAYKSLAGIPIVGPALAVVASAAAVASGIASVKKILAVKSGLPGDTGGGGSVSAPTAISLPAQRTFAKQVQPTMFTQPALTQQQVNALPAQQQQFPTAAEIAEAVKNIPPPIVTVEDINARTAETRKVEVRATV